MNSVNLCYGKFDLLPLTDDSPGKELLVYKNNQGLFDRWPFAIEKLQSELDTKAIESQAVDMVAQGLRNQRLTVFAGAGITMAYGRMTWSQLLDTMFLEAHDLNAKFKDPRSRAFETMSRRLWGDGDTAVRFSKFQENRGNYVVTAQLLGDAITARSPQQQFGKWVTERLKDHQHRLNQLLPLPDPDTTPENRPNDKSKRPPEKRAQLESDVTIAEFISAYILKKKDTEELRHLYKRAYLRWLSPQESALDVLINIFGIRRFVTTNYDHEIEHALAAFDYPDRSELEKRLVAQHGTWHKSWILNRDTTGEALCFAAEGARRHAGVLHLHGDCGNPDGLVVTEADYQHLYIEEHPKHDLLENAVQAVFGANPILFVGSSVEEEEIMRPLRQFMTGAPHRRNRLAVALLPAEAGDIKAAQQKLLLYIRFGVYAIHYGYLTDPDDSERRVNVLATVKLLYDHWSKMAEKLKAGTLQKIDFPPSDDGETIDWAKLNQLRGWKTDDEQFTSKYGELIQCFYLIKTELEAVLHSDTASRVKAASRISLALEELRSAFVTVFMCSALTDLHRRASNVLMEEKKLPNIWLRPTKDVEKFETREERVLFTRHAVSLSRERFDSWFVKGFSNGAEKLFEPKEALKSVLAKIRNTPFSQEPGRRVLVISSPRGAGKGALFDSLANVERLSMFCGAMGGYPSNLLDLKAPDRPCVFHINFGFSNEISPVIAQFANTLLSLAGIKDVERSVRQDQLELVALALETLIPSVTPEKKFAGRCLLLMGNAGVLFDDRGDPKNGLVRRVFQLIDSPAFAGARLDIVMFCSESNVPRVFRSSKTGGTSESEDGVTDDPTDSLLLLRDRPPDRSIHRMMRRRQQRLNINWTREAKKQSGFSATPYLLVGLTKIKADLAWRWFFHLKREDVPPDMDEDGEPIPPVISAELDAALLDIYRATGASRMSMTLIWAYARLAVGKLDFEEEPIIEELNVISRALQGTVPEIAAERSTAIVMDLWYQRHLRGKWVMRSVRCTPDDWTTPPTEKLTQEKWKLATELMWTLSFLSQPATADDLAGCPPIVEAAIAVNTDSDVSVRDIIEDRLEQLVYWGFLFRIGVRPGGGDYRYSPHRQVQRHFLILSGGRNVETTRWDQVTATLYASQPDELPTLPRTTRIKIVNLVKSLSMYPEAFSGAEEEYGSTEASRGRLRTAYALLTACFSLGVLARSTEFGDEVHPKVFTGVMEEYRRLVQWIIYRAKMLEKGNSAGVFYPGERLWLYGEVGVIALAQGKANQAEEYLAYAERAAHELENDNSGSLHVRVRLNFALVMIERGRPSQAQSVLVPISKRRSGHPVPQLIAVYYLGVINHLGGNYRTADHQYREAEAGLRKVGRSRALAFVVRSQADLLYSLNNDDLQRAIALAKDAMSIAQHGGHEDIRVIASLTRIRLVAKSGDPQGVFAELDFAEQYAIRMEIPRIEGEVHELRANHLFQQGETTLSAREAIACLEIAALYDLKLMKARAMLILARIYLERGDVAGSNAFVRSGKELATSAGYFSCVRAFTELEVHLKGQKRSA